MERRLLKGACIAFALFLPRQATCQAIFEQFNFQVSFSPPGAVAKGMGRAFTAAANDPSGAETNPGSLAQNAVGNQYMVEGAAPRYLTTRASTQNAFVTGEQSTTGDRTFIPAHFAFVRAKPGRSWVFTGFVSTFLSYSESFSLERRQIPDSNVYFLPTDGVSRLSGRTLGLGVGWRGVGGRLGVGVSGRLQRLKLDVDTRRGDIFDVVLDPTRLSNVENIHGADWRFGLVAGAAWVVPGVGRRFRVGASYTYNPTFRFTEEQTYADGSSVAGFPRAIRLSLPDRAAVGFSFVPFSIGDREALVVVEIDRTRHSELAGTHSTLLPDIPGFPPADFSVRDTTDLHVGARLGVSESTRLLLGLRTVQGHSFNYNGEQTTTTGRALELAFDFISDRRRIGYSAGLSRAFGPLEGTVSWDVVPNHSSEVSISFVLRR